MKVRVPRPPEGDEFVKVDLGGPVDVGPAMTRSALVGRVDGELKAYANVCRHRAIPLDLGADTPMAMDGIHLLCHQHGALYRPDDGYCFSGPCAGESLVSLQVIEDEEGIFVVLP
jgi:nitrite reductase/ring-hydroxylating ferredoxin subunit